MLCLGYEMMIKESKQKKEKTFPLALKIVGEMKWKNVEK